MSWFLLALKRYTVFAGRSRRKEYWFFTLFYLLILFGRLRTQMVEMEAVPLMEYVGASTIPVGAVGGF